MIFIDIPYKMVGYCPDEKSMSERLPVTVDSPAWLVLPKCSWALTLVTQPSLHVKAPGTRGRVAWRHLGAVHMSLAVLILQHCVQQHQQQLELLRNVVQNVTTTNKSLTPKAQHCSRHDSQPSQLNPHWSWADSGTFHDGNTFLYQKQSRLTSQMAVSMATNSM